MTNVATKTTEVEHDDLLVRPEELVHALNAACLGARLKRDSTDVASHSRWPSPLVLACGVLWVVSLGSVDEEQDSQAYQLKYVALGSVVLGLPRLLGKAAGALRGGILDINCLMTLSVAGAVGIGDFTEAAAVTFLFSLSEWLEGLASARSRKALSATLAMRPEEAVLATGQSVSAAQVRIGDRFIVRAGERVAVDGVVASGASAMDESMITGEPVPLRKRPGSPVRAGTINVGGRLLEIEATATVEDSTVARMVRLIEEAHALRSRTEALVQAFAKVYTPVVVVAAMLFASVPWIFLEREEAFRWLYTALVLLVVACPCAIVISTPITYVTVLTTAATHSVLIRGGECLETLGRVRTVCIDKTGTLSEGRFRVRDVLGPLGPDGPGLQRLLGLAASAERGSTHGIALALVAYAREQAASTDLRVEGLRERAGEGIEATVDGLRVQVGSRCLAERMGWVMGNGQAPAGPTDVAELEVERRVGEMEAAAQTVCYLGVGGRLAAVFGVADVPRAEAKESVAALQSLGIEVVMLTGSRQKPALAMAAQLGIELVLSELLPEGKVRAVQDLKSRAAVARGCRSLLGRCSKVAMVGDGINDAAALAAADVGVAMGAAGSDVALESSQVVLMDSDLRKLVMSIRLGHLAAAKIKQNIIFSLASKAVMVALTLAGFTSLWGAIIADLGSMLVVTVNASMVLGHRKTLEQGVPLPKAKAKPWQQAVARGKDQWLQYQEHLLHQQGSQSSVQGGDSGAKGLGITVPAARGQGCCSAGRCGGTASSTVDAPI